MTQLESIPAVGSTTAGKRWVLRRGRALRTPSPATAYRAVVPIEHPSGRSLYRRPRLSNAGDPSSRAALSTAAVVALQHPSARRCLYKRLLERGKKKTAALGTAMRKLVHIAFGVLKHQQEYRPQAP